jgi:hypothetical protein
MYLYFAQINSNIANVKKYSYPIKYVAAGSNFEMSFPKNRTVAVYASVQGNNVTGIRVMLCDGTKFGQAIQATITSDTTVVFTNPGGAYGQAHNFEYGYYYI